MGVVVIGRRTNGGQAFNLDQFRSQAPLAGVLPADNRPRREYHDLVAAYINAVESTEFLALTSAPLSIRSFIIFTSDSMTECIKAVVPSLSAAFTSVPA